MSDKMKILLIDDEPVVCSSCERFLSDEGYEIQTALKGKDGIKLVDEEDFDIVITDLKMPDISGMEVLEFLKKNYPDIQVIMVTGYSTISNAVESIKKGAFDYLPKPFTPDELLSVVRDASIKRMQSLEKIYRCKITPHKYGLDNIIAISDNMLKVFDLIEKVAPKDSTVLITGESGTGKELVARAIYNHSSRKDMQFIPVDCSALAESLLESELFGHIKGSFTGASAGKRGLFEIADKGTLFLDEVSNIPMDTQKKLLRVLESNEFRPVGAERVKKINIRLIAATNRNLKMMIKKDKFREDLYYRLNVFSIDIPPLRERPEDIPILANHFLRQICQTLDKRVKGFSKDAMEIMIKYSWPGNVRELRNAIENLVLIADEDLLSSEKINDIIDIDNECITNNTDKYSASLNNIDLKRKRKEARESAVREVEEKFVRDALARNNWNVTKAAEDTGMQRTNLQALIKKYDINIRDYTKKSDIKE